MKLPIFLPSLSLSLLLGLILPMDRVVHGASRDVVTQHNNNARTGTYDAEVQLTPDNVRRGSFGKLYERSVDGDILAQPLYVQGVRTPRGVKNLFFIATAKNKVYAFDADDMKPGAGAVWSRQLDTSRKLDVGDPPVGEICAQTYHGYVGITSTPVVDLKTQTMYVVSRYWSIPGISDDGTDYLHAINIADGSDRIPDSTIQIGRDPKNPEIAVTYNGMPFTHKCHRNRPGLLQLKGIIYIAYASFSCDQNCPSDPFHGWVFGYRASDLRLVAVFCTSCDSTNPGIGGAGIWQSGKGLVGASNDTIYFQTGNKRRENILPGSTPLSEAFVKLKVINEWPGLSLVGSFRPKNAAQLDSNDMDLGSSGPILLPRSRLIGGGKQGRFYVLNSQNMIPTQNSGIDWIQQNRFDGFQAFYNTWHMDSTQQPCDVNAHDGIVGSNCYANPMDYDKNEDLAPNIHSGPVYWEGLIYAMAEKDYLKAFKYDLNTRHVSENPVLTSTVRTADGMPGAALSISANGSTNGVVWATFPWCADNPSVCDAKFTNKPGRLVAFDAATLKELWRDNDNVLFAKFTPPTIADGKVYRPTFSGKVIVYGLLPKKSLNEEKQQQPHP